MRDLKFMRASNPITIMYGISVQKDTAVDNNF
jgi:hypothetical protein